MHHQSSVIKNLNDNSEKAKLLLSEIIPNIYVSSSRGLCSEGCQNSLDNAVMTSPEKRDPLIMHKLEAIAGRVLWFRIDSWYFIEVYLSKNL